MHCVAGLNDRNFNQGLTRSYRVKPIRVSSQRSPVPKVPAIATDFRLTYRYDLPSTMDTMQTTHTQSIPTACNCRLRSVLFDFAILPAHQRSSPCLHTKRASDDAAGHRRFAASPRADSSKSCGNRKSESSSPVMCSKGHTRKSTATSPVQRLLLSSPQRRPPSRLVPEGHHLLWPKPT